MPETHSALAGVHAPGRIGVAAGPAGVAVFERSGRTLVQVSGWPRTFDAACRGLETLCGCPMPGTVRVAVSRGARSIFRVGPERLWVAAPEDDPVLRHIDETTLGAGAVVTDIGHSRTVVRIVGRGARELLNRGLPVDLDPSVLPADAIAQSVIHHMPVLVHRAAAEGGDAFDAYVTREYAVSFWEWLAEAAQSFGCEIRTPE